MKLAKKSLLYSIDSQNLELIKITKDVLGCDLSHAKQIGGGRNSKVYKLVCANNKKYVLKFYFGHQSGNNMRQHVDYSAHRFLWKNGIRCIPEPIVANSAYNCAFYEYVSGKKLQRQDVLIGDIDQLVNFLTRLKEIKTFEGTDALPVAAEAFFSMKGIVGNIESRLVRLRAAMGKHDALKSFLEGEFIPTFEEIIKWGKSSLKANNRRWADNLSNAQKTLSPSDFGFHNAIKKNNEELVFFDFEYFGWDDPAKMISDFLLHPGMKLAEKLKHHFTINILASFSEDDSLPVRLKLVYPLFGLKWCMILLNEFIPQHLMRRQFAAQIPMDKNLKKKQLIKAENMLNKIKNQYERFPYSIC